LFHIVTFWGVVGLIGANIFYKLVKIGRSNIRRVGFFCHILLNSSISGLEKVIILRFLVVLRCKLLRSCLLVSKILNFRFLGLILTFDDLSDFFYFIVLEFFLLFLLKLQLLLLQRGGFSFLFVLPHMRLLRNFWVGIGVDGSLIMQMILMQMRFRLFLFLFIHLSLIGGAVILQKIIGFGLRLRGLFLGLHQVLDLLDRNRVLGLRRVGLLVRRGLLRVGLLLGLVWLGL